jgi:hypothetical protein
MVQGADLRSDSLSLAMGSAASDVYDELEIIFTFK